MSVCCYCFQFFLNTYARVCLNETVCGLFFLFSYVCWGAFNIFFIVFHLVFTSVPHTCSMLFGNARIHRDSFFHTIPLCLSRCLSIGFVPPSHPHSCYLYLSFSLSLHSSLYFSLALFHFIVLFLPYFSAFVADFEASNTDTQPYQIPYQNNNNNHRNTIYLYVHIVWYILKCVYTYTQIDVCAYARADNNNNIDFGKVIVVHPVRLCVFFCCCCYFFFSFYPLCSYIYRSHRHTSNIAQALKRYPSGDYHTPSSHVLHVLRTYSIVYICAYMYEWTYVPYLHTHTRGGGGGRSEVPMEYQP